MQAVTAAGWQLGGRLERLKLLVSSTALVQHDLLGALVRLC